MLCRCNPLWKRVLLSSPPKRSVEAGPRQFVSSIKPTTSLTHGCRCGNVLVLRCQQHGSVLGSAMCSSAVASDESDDHFVKTISQTGRRRRAFPSVQSLQTSSELWSTRRACVHSSAILPSGSADCDIYSKLRSAFWSPQAARLLRKLSSSAVNSQKLNNNYKFDDIRGEVMKSTNNRMLDDDFRGKDSSAQTSQLLRQMSSSARRSQKQNSNNNNKTLDSFRGEVKSAATQLHQQMRAQGAELKKENIYTVPNALCLVRIGLAPVLAVLVCNGVYTEALAVFCVAGVTDLLDGQIARHFAGQQSALGSILDPIADKLLISVLFVSLTAVDIIPIALTALVIARDVALLAGGCVLRYQKMDPPKTLSKYFDLSRMSIRVLPSVISKVNTAVQLSLVGVSLCAPVFGFLGHPALYGCWYLAAATTLVSGVDYARSYRNAIEVRSSENGAKEARS